MHLSQLTHLSRRDLLKLGLLTGTAAGLPLARLAQAVADGNPPTSPFFQPFQLPLPIPPNHVKTVTPNADVYHVVMREAFAQILPDPRLKTRVFTYNGFYPGQTFQVRRGRPVVVTQRNHLPVNTSVHLHGAVVDGNSDGHPLDIIRPGGVKVYTYPNPDVDSQSARTEWYHDHAVDITGSNVYHGLAGFYLIHDASEIRLRLPTGRFDIPLVLQDRRFNADGSLFFPVFDTFDSNNGVFGDTIVVNGAQQPFLRVEPRRYRFRVLDGSNARQYRLQLSNDDPLILIATEGGFLERPVFLSSLFIAQAERYEFIIDFTHLAGKHIVLRNTNLRSDDDPTRIGNLVRFDVTLPLSSHDTSQIPSFLRRITPIPESEAKLTRHFEFARDDGQWAINKRFFDETLARVDARPRSGDIEIWELKNGGGGWRHPIHIHLINFQILDRNGGPPLPWEHGWKETVLLHEGETVRVIIRWYDVPAGPPRNPPDGKNFKNKYVFHCHNLEHEDHAMMGEIEVQPRR